MRTVAAIDESTNATLALVRAATVLDPQVEPCDNARTFYAAMPYVLGATGRPNTRDPFARSLTRAWRPRPSDALVAAINTALVVLADHELATSTLAARVATSVRSAYPSTLAAALATVDGELHGSASHYVHRLFATAHRVGPEEVLQQFRQDRRRVPGFGHTIYRQRDPRVSLLLDRVRALPDRGGRLATVEQLLRAAGSYVAQPPNVDLALGALTFVADLPEQTPIFPVARVAGWTAHHLEELEERPVRFRGLAR